VITFGNLKIHSPQITAVYGTSMLKRSPAIEKKNNVSCEIQEFLERMKEDINN